MSSRFKATLGAQPEIVARRKTADGRAVLVWSDGAVTSGDTRPWTKHRKSFDVPTALLIAAEASLFDAGEMPSLIAAAHTLAPRSPRGILPGELRALASQLSHKAGTRPSDVVPPARRR